MGGIAGFVDGLALLVQCNDSIVEQNSAYIGHRHDTTCNNVLVFALTGKYSQQHSTTQGCFVMLKYFMGN